MTPADDAPRPAPASHHAVPDTTPELLRAALIEAIRDACDAGRGIPASLEAAARDHARAQREAGLPVEKLIIQMKDAIRRETGQQEFLFLPRVIGWTVAGYFAGTSEREEA
jgi:hypothetical protein